MFQETFNFGNYNNKQNIDMLYELSLKIKDYHPYFRKLKELYISYFEKGELTDSQRKVLIDMYDKILRKEI